MTTRHRGLHADEEPAGGLPNPGRGFRHEIKFSAADMSVPYPLEGPREPWTQARTFAGALAETEAIYGDFTTVTQLYFYLWEFAAENEGDPHRPLSDEALANVDAALQAVADAGYRAVLRFAYDDPNRPDRWYTVETIERHLAQLAPVVAAHRRSLVVWQAGFVGCWGEWGPHRSKLIATDDGVRAVVDAVVGALPEGVPLQMRYPWHRAMVTDDDVRGRIGLANDYATLGGGKWDYYTPEREWWLDLLELTPRVPIDGELPWDPIQDTVDPYAWSQVVDPLGSARRLQSLHYGTFSLTHNHNVTFPAWRSAPLDAAALADSGLPVSREWLTTKDGAPAERSLFDYVRDHLGYRIEAVRTDVGRTGQALEVRCTVRNLGFSAPVGPRSVEVLLLDDDGAVLRRAATGADWTTWFGAGSCEGPGGAGEAPEHAAGAVVDVAGLDAGRYRVALALHDGDTVRLANGDVAYDPGTGANVLTTVEL